MNDTLLAQQLILHHHSIEFLNLFLQNKNQTKTSSILRQVPFILFVVTY